MSTYLNHYECLQCATQLGAEQPQVCTACGSEWHKAVYDYEQISQIWSKELATRSGDLWRYHELLPVEFDPKISMHEGMTPLYRLNFHDEYPNIYVKDERRNPTSSFKARQAALAVTEMRQKGITACAIASTGNSGIAYSAYCARAGIKLWLFVSSRVPQEKMREAALYGAEVVKVSGDYDEAKRVAHEFAKFRDIYYERGARSIASRASMKTLAYEIAEQLHLQSHPTEPGKFVSPDWYIQAVSGGIGVIGTWQGFTELFAMGLIDKMPRLGIVQVKGCAPMVQAFEKKQSTAEPIVPSTLITVLSTGNPGYGYTYLYEAVTSNGGTMISVEDGEAFHALRTIARRTGLSIEPATAVAFAGLEKLVSNGTIKPDETVVVNCSGHTMPVESYILDTQYLLELEIQKVQSSETGKTSESLDPELTSAFASLHEQITSILIVDDNASDRRLIKRLLQKQKKYRIYEANDGDEGFDMALEFHPDLIVTDLTMPRLDGFGLIQKLKNNPITVDTPIVVISAKSLSAEDRATLRQLSDSVWTKGNFNTRQLTDHVVEVLGGSPIEIIHQKAVKPASQTTSPEKHPKHTVLVIDDDAKHRRLVRRLLETNEVYRVIEAATGQAGLDLIAQDKPDLVILDLLMPDIDGFKILEQLQTDADLCDIPIIVASAKDLTEEDRRNLRDRIRSLVRKANLDRKQFLAMVNQALDVE